MIVPSGGERACPARRMPRSRTGPAALLPTAAGALALTVAACGSAPANSDYVKVGEERALAEASEMLPADPAASPGEAEAVPGDYGGSAVTR